ncbi:MAG: lipocalin-like domain-containing protein [Pseudomonadota bacterium]
MTPTLAAPQGFAGLGTEAEGFAIPERRPFDFPADHGPHPDFRIEWWYVTSTLTAADGTDYGIQWTLFRTALAPSATDTWDSPQLWMGHAALTTPDQHFVAERLARGGIGQAGAQAEPFNAWIDEWHMRGPDLNNVNLTAQGPDFAYDLNLTATTDFVPQGDNGYSVKSSEGQASHYYSQPFYTVTGTLTLPTGPVEVTGNAWLDREWSSQPLSEGQDGWDWFSLAFDDGARLMGFRLRDDILGDYTAATWIDPDGSPKPYPNGAFTAVPGRTATVAGRTIPVEWQITLPDRGVDVFVTPLNDQSWMDTSFPYWEGPIYVEGSHTGRGYLEMTGYE